MFRFTNVIYVLCRIRVVCSNVVMLCFRLDTFFHLLCPINNEQITFEREPDKCKPIDRVILYLVQFIRVYVL